MHSLLFGLSGFLNQEAVQFGILNATFSCNLPLQLVAHSNAQGHLSVIAAEFAHIPDHHKASFFPTANGVFGYIFVIFVPFSPPYRARKLPMVDGILTDIYIIQDLILHLLKTSVSANFCQSI